METNNKMQTMRVNGERDKEAERARERERGLRNNNA